MTANVVFDASSIFEGFSVSFKINDELSKTVIISECHKKLENILDQLNLSKLKTILNDTCFIIKDSIVNIEEGHTVTISSLR